MLKQHRQNCKTKEAQLDDIENRELLKVFEGDNDAIKDVLGRFYKNIFHIGLKESQVK